MLADLLAPATPTKFLPAAPGAPAAPKTLATLIAEARAAWRIFDEKTLLTDSVRLGREPTDAEEAEYEAARQVESATYQALIDYEPTSWAEYAVKVAAFADKTVGDPAGIEDDILDALIEDSARLATRPDRAAWDAAMAAYRAIEAETYAAMAAYNEAEDAAWKDVPLPEILRIDEHRAYSSRGAIDHAHIFPTSRRDELYAAVDEWRPKHEAALEARGVAELEATYNAADRRLWQALLTLFKTPAPDLEAVAFKARDHLESEVLYRLDTDDLDAIFDYANRDPDQDGAPDRDTMAACLIYIDIKRLAAVAQ